MRRETVIARQLGNCLESTIQIPWEDVHGKNKRNELILTAQGLDSKGIPYHRIAEKIGKCL